MKPLTQLFRLTEAGVQHEPTGKLRKKWKSFASGGHVEPEEDDTGAYGRDEDGNRTYGGWLDPRVPPDDGDEPEAEPEPEKDTPFASKPAAPSKALQGGKAAGTIKADRMTLDALERALESVRTGDDDLQEWIDDLLSEIGRAIRSGGELTLPKFEATPSDLEDDEAGSEDED